MHTEKRCFKCGGVKSLDDFYVHPQMGDGHLNKCKDCTKRDANDHRQIKLRDPEWLRRERARCVEKQRRYMAAGRVPEYKERARLAVGYAIKRGDLVKPDNCQRCGIMLPKARIQAHHWDYSQPLNVTFVCAKCHAIIEGRARRAA